MLKVLNNLEQKIGDNVYQFFCAQTAPISEIKEALSQFLAYVIQIESQIKAQQAAKAEEDAKAAETVQPVVDIQPQEHSN